MTATCRWQSELAPGPISPKVASADLHPDKVSYRDIGLIFEELIRRFAELSNETAGEHLTPREVIGLMVNLLFIADDGPD